MSRALTKLAILIVCTTLISFLPEATAQIKLPAIFSDNMVLQRNAKIPVLGTGKPGQPITVKIQQQSKSTTADQDGKWRVDLAAMPAGGPYELAVSGTETITFKNVMLGEVWLCSGQSNMEMPLVSTWATVNNFKAEVVAANYPDLRLFIVKRAKAPSRKPTSRARAGRCAIPPASKLFRQPPTLKAIAFVCFLIMLKMVC